MAMSKIKKLIMTKSVNYILDEDIKGFFDNIDHKWLIKFLENENDIRYIVKFLKSGIMEDKVSRDSIKETSQGWDSYLHH